MKTAALMCAGLIFLAASTSAAQDNKQDEAAVKDIMKRQAMDSARQELNSHEWTVYMTPSPENAVKRPAIEEDVLSFSGEGRVVSKNLLAKGYPESNYTLTVQDDGTAVWETMQVNEKEGLAFFRGELKNSAMKGVLSLQPQKGAKQTFYFSTTKPEVPVQPAKEEAPKKKSKKR